MINKGFCRSAGILAFIVFLCAAGASAQEPRRDTLLTVDTTAVFTTDTVHHSPRLAAMLSAVIPGAGQVYNRKYWKVPVIYGGLVTLGYFIRQKHIQYSTYINYYSQSLDNTLTGPLANVPPEQILTVADAYRRNRDLLIIGTAAVYLMNILDATVDAHLYNFDVSDDLTFRLEPRIMPTASGPIPAFSLAFKF